MRITVKLFGPEAAAAGRSTVEVEVPRDICDAATLRSAVSEACPPLAERIDALRLAVNCEFADEDTTLVASDEVALIGQVSGG